MRLSNRLLLLAALFVLAIPLIFTGTASAKYQSDGAVPDGVGGWKTPNDGICVVGLHTDGTMDVVTSGIGSKRDCIYYTTGLTGMVPADVTSNTNCGSAGNLACNVKANCSGTYLSTGGTLFWNAADSKCYESSSCTVANATGNDGAKHALATSICSVSLAGLDRTAPMCTGIGGTWSDTNTAGFKGACVAYGWQYRGQDASGTPLAFGSKGTAQAAGTGFCYAKMNTTIAAASCPSTSTNSSTAFGYSVSGTKCQYAYGINGPVSSALTKADNTSVAAGTTVDLTAYTTMGACLANGGSWANWIPSSGTTDSTNGATTVTFDLKKQAVNADEGCLHCHSSVDQANGPAERWKDSYLKTGHKNMLRKVGTTPWAGPDGDGNLAVYTTDGTNAITFGTPSTAGANTLLFIYGDWMAPLPTTAVAGSGYSCGGCHTTGFNDSTNPGVQSIGTPGYIALEPSGTASDGTTTYASGVAAGHKWDIEGITCARCHNATVPSVTAAQIAASSFPTTYPTSGGMGNIPGGPAAMSTYSNFLCFGCHQSMAKTWPAGTTQNDPTLIPTGVSHGASAGRDFNGHVLGNSFLNSPHARFTGTVQINSLGKYDLVGGTYNSKFQGFTCWQGSTSTSPAKTKADGTEIKDKATCESLYGAGAWRSDTQGSCTTCHDVHNSLFVKGQEGIRKECVDCHANSDYAAAVSGTPQYSDSLMSHPKGAGTPWDATLYGNDPCAVCHMATQAVQNGNQNSMPVHVWRINTDPAYNTFPTADQFNGTNGATKDRNAQTSPDGTYTKAVWVDLDLACGQCHGGSLGSGKTLDGVQVPTLNKAQLSIVASTMHDSTAAKTNADCLTCHSTAQGDKRAINPGVDHHNGTCTTCHPFSSTTGHYQSAWTTAGVTAPNVNAVTKKTNTRETPNFDYWSIDTSLSTACLGCHSTTKTKVGGGSTYAIVPSGTGDNHHGGHSSVPGTSYGGVAKGVGVGTGSTPGSRGENDPGMNCLGCHGRSTIVSGDSSTGYTMKIAASGIYTTTVSGSANNGTGLTTGGLTPTSSLCLGCHEVIQSGAEKDHHSGACLTCHHADNTDGGTFMAGVGSYALAPTTTITSGKINDSIITSCLNCHATDKTAADGHAVPAIHPKLNTYGGIDDASGNQADNHHRGHSNTPVTGGDPGMYCLGCHGSATVSADGLSYSITGAGVPTSIVSAQKGFTGGATPTSSLCLACHSSVIQSGATQNHHTGACVTCHQVAAVPGGAGATNQCIGGAPSALCSTTAGVGGNVSYKPGDVASWSVNCTACHSATPQDGEPSAQAQSLATMAHPYTQTATVHTPSDCATCHSYSTYSYAGVTPTNYGAVCGQCHGGSLGTSTSNGAPYFDANTLASYAIGIHTNQSSSSIQVVFSASYGADNMTVVVDGSSSYCSGACGALTYSWNFGDGATATGAKPAAHKYAAGGSYLITLTVSDGTNSGTKARSFTAVAAATAPTTSGTFSSNTGTWSAQVVDTTTPGTVPLAGVQVTVKWGDGTSTTKAAGQTFTHTYSNAGSYIISQQAYDNAGRFGNVVNYVTSLTFSTFTISGTVETSDATGNKPIPFATVQVLKEGTAQKITVYTDANGSFSIANRTAGTYDIFVTKMGYTFPAIPPVIVGPDSTNTIKAN